MNNKNINTMFRKISAAFLVFLIFGLVAPIQANGPCSCEFLPAHTGTIIGNLDDLLDEVVSDVIEPVGSAVTSLLDNLLSGLLGDDGLLGGDSGLLGGGLLGGNSGLLGGVVGSDGIVDLDDLLGSEGIDLGDVVSEVGDLLEDLLDGDDLDLSECPYLNINQNHFLYRFNSAYANHLVLHGFSGEVLSVALFTGDCDELECVYSTINFCGDSNDLAVIVEPWTDYWIGIFGAPCDFVIDYDLSCHGNCGSCQTCN